VEVFEIALLPEKRHHQPLMMKTMRHIMGVGIIGAGLCVAMASFAQTISDVVDQVNQTTYQHYLDDLLYTHSADNRGYGAQHDLARANIYDQFSSYGLQTTLDPFTYGVNTYYNVIAVLPGSSTRSDQVYLVGAHYDSVGNPGADDNASGVAGVLAAAQVLSQYHFEATLVFAAFDREEQGLIGSWNYSSQHHNDDINGMVSLDMIANNNDNNLASIYGRAASDPIKQALSEAIALYGNGLVPAIGGDVPASDHAPFEANGFQACLLIEGNYSNNGNYHQPSDTVDTAGYIDYAYATEMTRSTVGFLATEAGLLSVPDSGGTLLLLGGSLVVIMGNGAYKKRCWYR
jgi:Zn-dependent M28 family amino/carboxypeptidase